MTIAVDLGRKATKQTKSISKILKPNFVCLLTNERYKRFQTGFSFCKPGSCLGVGLGGTVGGGGGGGGGQIFFSEIQPDLVEISSENIALFDLGSLVSLSMKHYPCLIKS